MIAAEVDQSPRTDGQRRLAVTNYTVLVDGLANSDLASAAVRNLRTKAPHMIRGLAPVTIER
jgi:hypothetical protein